MRLSTRVMDGDALGVRLRAPFSVTQPLDTVILHGHADLIGLDPRFLFQLGQHLGLNPGIGAVCGSDSHGDSFPLRQGVRVVLKSRRSRRATRWRGRSVAEA